MKIVINCDKAIERKGLGKAVNRKEEKVGGKER